MREECEGCIYYDLVDSGFGANERHDWFCGKWQEWNPGGCDEKQTEIEMSTEEKAKAYDEALKLAKNWIKDGSESSTKKCLELLFPELRESEDERINKAIFKALSKKDARNVLLAEGVQVSEALAYLEKQKEPHYTKRNALFDKCVENCDPKVMKEVSDKVDEMLGKEQKPILEVFGFKVGDAVRLKDGDGRKHIIKSFEEVEGIHGPNFYRVEFEDNSARDGIYPGEEYPNGYYTQMEKFEEEQKPAEWSEEDKTRLNNIIWAIHMKSLSPLDEMDDRDKYKGYENFLKSLPERFNLQPKQELSEEEFEVFRKTLTKDAFLDEITSIRVAKKLLDSVKSLRPSWKPSEEQMEALKKAVNKLAKTDVADSVRLSIMFDNLKKLM